MLLTYGFVFEKVVSTWKVIMTRQHISCLVIFIPAFSLEANHLSQLEQVGLMCWQRL